MESRQVVFKEINFKNIKENTYFISEDGQVYSKAHNTILKWGNRKGYAYVRLATKDGLNKEFSIAFLVITTYKGGPPKNMVDPTVDHINNRSLQNHYSNLQWLERVENSRKITPITKLTETEVHEICKALEEGNNPNRLSKQYDVTPVSIYKIQKRKTWNKISSMYNF